MLQVMRDRSTEKNIMKCYEHRKLVETLNYDDAIERCLACAYYYKVTKYMHPPCARYKASGVISV